MTSLRCLLVTSILMLAASVSGSLGSSSRKGCLASGSRSQRLPRHALVADVDRLVAKRQTWQQLMPDVKPVFAVKSNSAPIVLALLAAYDSDFMVLSRRQILDVLAVGVHPSRLLYVNAIAPEDELAFTAAHGIYRITIDDSNDLDRVARIHPKAKMFIRIKVSDNDTSSEGDAYGAFMDEVPALLQGARRSDSK